MKRFVALALIMACVLMLAGCGAESTKRQIFRLVEKNYDEILEACAQEDVDYLSAMDGITDVNILTGYVVAYCEGSGIAPSSQGYGFYYSAEDCPVAIGCNLDIVGHTWELEPEGDGYRYQSPDHNLFYTEHIVGSIYFYSYAY